MHGEEIGMCGGVRLWIMRAVVVGGFSVECNGISMTRRQGAARDDIE
jgi:hypothetical protein